MRDRIEIQKDNIPYSFEIMLGDSEFEMEVNYNESADLFTITLSKNESVLVYNEPIIYDVPLFTDCFDSLFPAITIVPLDESGECDTVTYDNFSVTVFLTIDDGGE